MRPGPSTRQIKELKADNKRWPAHLVRLTDEQLAPMPHRPPKQTEVWRSKFFLVQVFGEEDGVERLSVCRTAFKRGKWREAISWDDMQRLKLECGRGDKSAVEVFPAESDLVNVANMRHLFVLPEPLPFMWTATSPNCTEKEQKDG